MRILSVNINNNYTFQARRKEIRKADDLVRKVNQEIPAFSPTYAREFWFRFKKIKEGYTDKRIINSENKLERIRKKIAKEENPTSLFEQTREKKVGNCCEKTYLAMGALSANGINQYTRRYDVGVNWTAIDKRNGEKVFEDMQNFDHNIIITTLTNEEPKKFNDLIVIDGWLNKAMSLSEAHAEYGSMLKEKDISKMKEKAIINFVEENKKDYGLLGKKLPPDFDINNYEFKHNIVFFPHPDPRYRIKKDDFEKLGEMVREKYPSLVFKENK